MAIVRWHDPFREFAHLQERFNRVFSEASRAGNDEGPISGGGWLPAVDIYQTGDHEVVLKAELPDMSREDIDITVDGGTLTIKGEKKAAADVREQQYHRVERRYGAFSRSFALPQTVDTTKIGADYKNGVLTVKLPLRDEAKPRQVKIDVAA